MRTRLLLILWITLPFIFFSIYAGSRLVKALDYQQQCDELHERVHALYMVKHSDRHKGIAILIGLVKSDPICENYQMLGDAYALSSEWALASIAFKKATTAPFSSLLGPSGSRAISYYMLGKSLFHLHRYIEAKNMLAYSLQLVRIKNCVEREHIETTVPLLLKQISEAK